MAHIPITSIRFTESQAWPILQSYVFGGRNRFARVPRGVAPEWVERFLRQELKPDSEFSAYQRALQAMRFYEISTLGPHLRTFLTGQEKTYSDMRKSAVIIQALGDFGVPGDVKWS